MIHAMGTIVSVVLIFSATTLSAGQKETVLYPDKKCSQNKDCLASCSFGGVSEKWYLANRRKISECMDGCSGWGRSVRCINQQCLIYQGDKLDQFCNNIKYRELLVPVQ